MNWLIYTDGLLIMLAMAFVTWLLSLYLRDVSIVDSAWSLMFLAAATVYLIQSNQFGFKNIILISLVSIWAVRLASHLTWRNWAEPEDRRYQAIRKKYSPNFEFKSLFIIFIFQAILAWMVSLPLLGAFTNPLIISPLTIFLFGTGVFLWFAGMFFETVADWQLARFKNEPSNHGKVMDQGLWRYSRHPNYFGECIIWWGFYLMALSVGAWWSIVAPLIMTWLLLKFSGVVMLEETISDRRPGYQEYIKRTNAFFPGRVNKTETNTHTHIEEHA